MLKTYHELRREAEEARRREEAEHWRQAAEYFNQEWIKVFLDPQDLPKWSQCDAYR